MDTGLPLTLLCLLAITTSVLSQDTFNFDCRREDSGALCAANNGKCNIDNGDCVCLDLTVETNFHTYLCQEFAPTSDCPVLCQNGGRCSGGTCRCTAGYYGPGCVLTRVQVDCDVDRMFVNVFPHASDFQGQISVLMMEDVPDCQLTEPTPGNTTYSDYVKNSDDLEGLNLEIPHTSETCGDANSTTDPSGLSESHTRKFVIRYSTSMESSVDQVISTSCTLVEGSSDVSGSIQSIVGADLDVSGLDEVSVDSQVELVTMALVNENGDPLDTAVYIGQSIQMVFTLAEGNEYTDLKVDSCTANNTLASSSPDFKELTFVSGGCPTNLAIFYGMITKTSSPVVVNMPIKVFRFFGPSDRVAFTCSITLCTANETGCADSDCQSISSTAETAVDTTNSTAGNATDTGDTNSTATDTDSGNSTDANSSTNSTSSSNSTGSGLVRRRRDTPGHTQTTAVLTVLDRFHSDEEVIQLLEERAESHDCMKEDSVVTLVVILSVAVGLLLLLTTILVLRLISGRASSNSRRHAGADLPPYTRQVDSSMSIPRLELHQGQGC